MKGSTSRYEIEVSISLAMENRPSSAISAHLSFVHTRRGCGIVFVVSPRRMMEMDDEIPVVRHDRPVEGDGSDAAPIPEGALLAEEGAEQGASFGFAHASGDLAAVVQGGHLEQIDQAARRALAPAPAAPAAPPRP